jgi:hypothetical protein
VIERHRHRLQGIELPTVSPEGGERSSEHEAISRPRQPAKRSPAERTARQARYQHRLTQRQQVHALREQGQSILGIAQRLDLNRSTSAKFPRQPLPGNTWRLQKPPRPRRPAPGERSSRACPPRAG